MTELTEPEQVYTDSDGNLLAATYVDDNGDFRVHHAASGEEWTFKQDGTLDVPALSTEDGTVGNKRILGGPDAAESASGSLGGGWVSESATQDVLLILEAEAETDGSTHGTVALDVDYSGGTTADETYTLARASSVAGSGFTERILNYAYLPAGAQYRLNNFSDPTGDNRMLNTEKVTL